MERDPDKNQELNYCLVLRVNVHRKWGYRQKRRQRHTIRESTVCSLMCCSCERRESLKVMITLPPLLRLRRLEFGTRDQRLNHKDSREDETSCTREVVLNQETVPVLKAEEKTRDSLIRRERSRIQIVARPRVLRQIECTHCCWSVCLGNWYCL